MHEGVSLCTSVSNYLGKSGQAVGFSHAITIHIALEMKGSLEQRLPLTPGVDITLASPAGWGGGTGMTVTAFILANAPGIEAGTSRASSMRC